MTKSVKQLLIEAKALITDPAKWCQDDFAQNEEGDAVDALSDQAKCRCSLGALGCAAGLDPSGPAPELTPAIRLLDDAATKLTRPSEEDDEHYATIVDLNDGAYSAPKMTSHQAVMAAFDIAIEHAPV